MIILNSLETYAPWEWSYGGEVWGFDPRVAQDNPIEQLDIPDDTKATIVTEHMWKCVRVIRDIKLKETDWVSGEDVPQALKDIWFTYRQALRDVTSQSDPINITWPTKPQDKTWQLK